MVCSQKRIHKATRRASFFHEIRKTDDFFAAIYVATRENRRNPLHVIAGEPEPVIDAIQYKEKGCRIISGETFFVDKRMIT
jgi:hypothetical protein